MENLPCTPGEIAKQRLEKYIEEKLKGYWDDVSAWEFWTYLLEKAEGHPVDNTGYCPLAYQDDRAEALKNYKKTYPPKGTFHLPERRKRNGKKETVLL